MNYLLLFKKFLLTTITSILKVTNFKILSLIAYCIFLVPVGDILFTALNMLSNLSINVVVYMASLLIQLLATIKDIAAANE